MRAAKTKAGGGSGIHRLQVAKVKGTIRPNPAGHSEPGEKTSARGMDYGTHVQETRMDGWAPSENRLGHKRGGACKAKGGEAKKWIQGMHMKKGALHSQLHVPQGQKIPAAKLAKAEHSSNPKLARRARLAETLKGLHHKG
jgi:hypothetical protein